MRQHDRKDQSAVLLAEGILVKRRCMEDYLDNEIKGTNIPNKTQRHNYINARMLTVFINAHL